jgi:hypothetical protein
MSEWHLDKRVPVALIATLILQTVSFGVWVGTIQTRVDANERALEASADTGERLARIEAILERVERRLDREE